MPRVLSRTHLAGPAFFVHAVEPCMAFATDYYLESRHSFCLHSRVRVTWSVAATAVHGEG